VPPAYRLCFQEGLGVLFERRTGVGGNFLANLWRGLRGALRDSAALVFGPQADLLRLRVRLADEDAAALYRCLPPGPKLLLIGWAPAAAGRPAA